MIDLALYTLYENYASSTRKAYTSILPWYANYIVPPARRHAACKRTEHLGISSLDADGLHDSLDGRQDEPLSTAERKFNESEVNNRARLLSSRKRTVTDELQRQTHAGAFRLKAIADSFYEPLANALDRSATDSLSPSEYLAYGYLSLLLRSDGPQSWAADIMKKDYPSLVKFVDRVEHDLNLRHISCKAAPREGFMASVTAVGQALLHQMPFTASAEPVASRSRKPPTIMNSLPQTLLTAVISASLAGVLLFRNGMWPRGDKEQMFQSPRIIRRVGLFPLPLGRYR